MIDVGCGPNWMVQIAELLGVDACGIDGDRSVNPNIVHNFDNGNVETSNFDLAWSVEFLEHIEEKYLDNVFDVFKRCKYVFCTHNPNSSSWHFNCQPNSYWLHVFKDYGFKFDSYTTEQIKLHSTMSREFVQNSGMFFMNGG